MRRRDFITVALASAFVGGFPALAQEIPHDNGVRWHIGLIHVGLDHDPPSLTLLRRILNELGYKEGQNLEFDWRNQPDQAAADATAREFARVGVDLIVAFEDQSVRAAQAATTTIPIVFLHVNDPVEAGFVESLSHPGGSTTGFVSFPHVLVKQIEVLKEFVPGLRRILLLVDPTDPATPRELQAAYRACAALHLDPVEGKSQQRSKP